MYATGIAVLLIGIGTSQLGNFFRKPGVGFRLRFRRGVWWPTHTLKPLQAKTGVARNSGFSARAAIYFGPGQGPFQ
jgi:hypothetical protein